MQMRVLHVITSLNVGGAERSLASVTRALNDGYEHAAILLGDLGPLGAQLREAGMNVLAMGMPSPLLAAKHTPHLVALLREFRPTILQGWMYHGNIAAYLIAMFYGRSIPVLWNVRHCLYEIRDEKRLTQLLIRAGRTLSARVCATIYNSALSRAQHESFGFRGRGHVIANGFDLNRWRPDAEQRSIVRAELGITDASAKVVGHFARFHPMKDHGTFLRAIGVLLSRMPQAHAVLAGANVTYDNETLSALIAPEHRSRVHLLGERSDLERLMRALDVFCLSSWSEAFPNVVGEAMASGVPCVATDVGDCCDIVGDTGVVVVPRCPSALAAALLDFLARCSSDISQLGAAARSRMAARFSLQAMALKYRCLYEAAAQADTASARCR